MTPRQLAVCFTSLAALHFGGVVTPDASAHPQNKAEELKRLTLDELLQVRVTTVERQESTVGLSAAAVHVITQEDIRRSGATTLPELLRRVPGMNVARVDANKWAVSVRGFNDRLANKLLVQIDGRTVYSPIFSGVFWNTLDYPLDAIDRIEVIRGPGGSTWGSNAVNGVINILTKSASDTPGGSISVGIGNEERGFGTATYGGELGDSGDYRVYAKGFNRDQSFGVSPAPFDGWSGVEAGFRTDWAHNGHGLTLQGDYQHSESARVDFRPQPTPPFTYTNLEQQISNGSNLLARWNRARGGGGWTVQAYWDRTSIGSTGDTLVFAMDTFDVDVQHESRVGARHRLVWGGGYRGVSAEFTDSRFDGFILDWNPNQRALHTSSAFVQDRIAVVADRLSLTLGTKLERNSLTGFEVQPTARFLWTMNPRQAAWGAVSRAVRIPTLFEDQRDVTQSPAPSPSGVTQFQRIVANPDLDSETLVAYEVGYRTQATATLSLDAAVFYNDYEGLKVFAPAGSTAIGAPEGTSFRLSTHRNWMAGRSHGLELAGRWASNRPWRIYGAYTFLRMDLLPDAGLPASVRAMSEAAERQSPEHQIHLQSSLDLPAATEIDLTGRFVGALPGFQQPVDGYFALDARVGWRPHRKLLVELVGHNLLQDHHLEVGGGVLVAPLHEIERSVYAKFGLSW
jgi:iron complex outermembrane receptor protein